MPMDGLTIGAVCAELNALLCGAKIDKINQPEEDELILLCRRDGKNHKLLLCSNANFARIGITAATKQNPLAAPAFCMLLRKHLLSSRLLSFSQENNERIVNITFEGYNDFNEPEQKILILEIMGKHSNIILTDASGKILDCIRHVNSLMSRVRQLQPGLLYTLPPSQGKQDPFNTEIPDLEPSPRILCDTFTGISRQAAEEISFLSREQSFPAAFSAYLQKFRQKNFSPVVQIDEAGIPLDFFAFPQARILPAFQLPRATISEAIDTYFSTRDTVQRLKERAHGLKSKLSNLLEKCLKKQAQQQEKLSECADMEKYRIWGELITANIYRIKRGASSVRVQNYYEDMAEIDIPLDPTISPNINAQKYFKQYSKLKTASRLLSAQMAANEKDIDFISDQLENLEKCETDDDIAQIRNELTAAGYLKPQKGKQKIPENKPMHFVSSSGIDIFVGKNNTQNDYLPLRFAGSDDLWLHTKNIHGSHVIIRAAAPDEKTIEEAAKLAVYYSKGRFSSAVPVDATRRRYVKKPSGALAGNVIYTNQTTYYVTVEENEIKSLKKL